MSGKQTKSEKPNRRSPLWFLPLRGSALAGVLSVLAGLLEPLGHPWCLVVQGFGVIAVLLLALTALLLVDRKPRWALAAFLCAAFAGQGAVALLVPDRGREGRVLGSFTVAQANVLTGNRNITAVMDWIRRTDPDLLAVQEEDHWWNGRLEPVRRVLSHYRGVQTDDAYGIGLYSRWPFTSGEIVTVGDSRIPEIRVVVDMPTGPLQVVVLHLVPPGDAAVMAERREHLEELARLSSSASGRLILCGDFNCVPWARDFRHLVDAGGLRDSRSGQGVCHTWRDGLLFPVLGFPIDSVLYRGALNASSFEVGPTIDSDHRPIVVRFQVLEDS